MYRTIIRPMSDILIWDFFVFSKSTERKKDENKRIIVID
jgi:hypothetical protein